MSEGVIVSLPSATLLGIDAQEVRVEVDVSPGLFSFTIVGLADAAVQESKERIRSALRNVFDLKLRKRIIVNLSPANIRKRGSLYDLSIAVALLFAEGVVCNNSLDTFFFIGEVSLDGGIRGVDGVLSLVSYAKDCGISTVFVPAENAQEAAMVTDVTVIGVSSLTVLVQHLNGKKVLESTSFSVCAKADSYSCDFSEVYGQDFAKRALEIAAAGGHNVLLSGPPGSGKTMMAKALPSILPELTYEEMLEVVRVHSVSGLLRGALVMERPFRAPHHSASGAALIGGGANPLPGEVSLAHRGVLFLDEFPEFSRYVLEHLRQPLEDGMVNISRAQQRVTYPAQFTLVASMNPCPCGNYGVEGAECSCRSYDIERYQSKLSGPLLDRIDLQVGVVQVPVSELGKKRGNVEQSAVIRERVVGARDIQKIRFAELEGVSLNSEMSSSEVLAHGEISLKAERLLQLAAEKMKISVRSYFRILKVSRTIADLAGSEKVLDVHVSEALQFRMKI